MPYWPETYPTERAAKRKQTELLASAHKGQQADPNRMTVRELMLEWLEGESRRRVRPTTLEDYEAQVRLHVLPALGNARVHSLTTPILQRYYDGLLAAGKSRRLAQVALQRLRSALSYAVHMQYVPYNAATEVRIVAPERKEMKVWTPEQAGRFLEVARHHAYHPLWDLALNTGMRRGELLGLRWDDIDLERATLAIRRTVEPVRGGLTVQRPKNGRERLIELDATGVAILREHRARQGERRLKLGDAWEDPDIVLATNIGTYITPTNVTRAFIDLVARAGVERIRVHDLRHTAATLMLLAGTPIKVVSERLGHASIQITLDYYAHLLPAMQRESAEKVRQLLAASFGSKI
jgi:integrase